MSTPVASPPEKDKHGEEVQPSQTSRVQKPASIASAAPAAGESSASRRTSLQRILSTSNGAGSRYREHARKGVTSPSGRGKSNSPNRRGRSSSQSKDGPQNATAVEALQAEKHLSLDSQLQLIRSDHPTAGLLKDVLEDLRHSGPAAVPAVIARLDGFHEAGHDEDLQVAIERQQIRIGDEFTVNTKLLLEEAKLTVVVRAHIAALQHSLDLLLDLATPLRSYIVFWRRQHRQPLVHYIESGPFTWFQPPGQIPTCQEKIQALQTTLENHLVKMGGLKKRIMEIQSAGSRRHLLILLESSRSLLEETMDPGTVVLQGGESGGMIEQMDSPKVNLFVSHTPQMISLRELAAFLRRAAALETDYAMAFHEALEGLVPPSRFRRKWMTIFLMSSATLFAARWLYTHRREISELSRTAQNSIREFWEEHMVQPLNNIVGELFLNKKTQVSDAKALVDAKESLQRMLEEFIKERYPEIDEEERRRLVLAMDMSVVSRVYERQIPAAVKNIFSGDIVRMLLIQVQFIKKELMVAMGAIDELMDANQLNLELMATIPVFLAVSASIYGVRAAWRGLYRFYKGQWESDAEVVHWQVRFLLRDIERMLNLRNRPGVSGISLGGRESRQGGRTRASTLGKKLRALSEDIGGESPSDSLTLSPHGSEGGELEGGAVLGRRDLGFLLLLLHALRNLIAQNRFAFEEEELEQMDQDLDDLVRDELLVSQQLATIDRMYRTYVFLSSRRFQRNQYKELVSG